MRLIPGVLTVVAALPMAIFGILPQAVVADISQSDSITSGSNREGMFYAARTFAFKLGQSISMLIFTAVSTIGAAEGTGYRVAAFGAAVFCCIGGIILVFYNEKKINGIIDDAKIGRIDRSIGLFFDCNLILFVVSYQKNNYP